MASLIFLVPIALALGALALAAFFWSLRHGQYEDLEGAGERIFLDADADHAGARHTPRVDRAGSGQLASDSSIQPSPHEER